MTLEPLDPAAATAFVRRLRDRLPSVDLAADRVAQVTKVALTSSAAQALQACPDASELKLLAIDVEVCDPAEPQAIAASSALVTGLEAIEFDRDIFERVTVALVVDIRGDSGRELGTARVEWELACPAAPRDGNPDRAAAAHPGDRLGGTSQHGHE